MTAKPRSFYVGYLSLPPRLRIVVAGLVFALLSLVAFDAVLFARLQPDPGTGKSNETPKEFVGTLFRDPYSSLRVATNGKLRTFLLVSDEKRSAEAELSKFADGTTIKLLGHEIERAAVGMVQLASAPVSSGGPSAIPVAPREIKSPATVEGEIIDSKCWLGVMRPGDGHIHKSCASLCIRGGIPPMFVTRAEGVPAVMLLTLSDGTAVPPAQILEFIADRVRLTGVVEKRDDVFVFKADLSTLHRSE